MMGLLIAILLSAPDAAEGTGMVPEARAPEHRFGITLGLGVDAQPQGGGLFIANTAAWGDLDLSFRPLRWLRLNLVTGGGYSPPVGEVYPGHHGLFRVLAGADFLLELRWGDLFAGAAGGLEHTNLLYDEVFSVGPGYSTGWVTGGCLLVRAGIEFRLHERIRLGGEVAYSLFAGGYVEVRQALELHARVSYLF
jgi:hypothetical protein